MLKKVAVLAVVAAFAALALAAPAFAADAVKARGTVVYSTVEGPHYELVVTEYSYDPAYPKPGSYVLQGPFNFKRYLGRYVEVKGVLYDGPSIWMKPAVYVTKITPLDAAFVPSAKK
ncbi:MAG: hypothetical protein H5T97_06815 [Firmicutes bacterium]|nr:hypothetical protein [Bacillota bacterium]